MLLDIFDHCVRSLLHLQPVRKAERLDSWDRILRDSDNLLSKDVV